MEILRFQYSGILWLLLIAIPLLGLFVYFVVDRKNRLKSFGSHQSIKRLASDLPKHKHQVKFLLLLMAFALMVLGAANLQFGSKLAKVQRQGTDIILAIDLSRSMNARDVTPSRLAKSKLFANTFIDQLAGDRIGLVVFAGNAFLQSPLTTDYSAIKIFLSTLETDLMPSQGTAIGEAIKIGMEAFDPESAQGKTIIVVSDGEDHDGEAMKAAEEANELGIVVQTIGVGTVSGKPVPVYDRLGRRDYQRDKSGNIITSKLNEIMLSKIATTTSGGYFRLDNSSKVANAVYGKLDKLNKAKMETQVFTEYESRFQIFFLLAFIMLLLELLISERRNKWLKKQEIFD